MPPWAPDFNGLLRIAHDLEPIDLGCWQAPFTVPHDAREPLQLRGTDGAVHLGILTDLGHASEHVKTQLAGCHTLLVEANHDPAMLAASRYPLFLQRRIAPPMVTWPIQRPLSFGSAETPVARPRGGRPPERPQRNTPALAQEALASALDCRLSASAWPARRRERPGSRWEWLDRKQILLAKQAMTPTAALLQSEQRHGATKTKPAFRKSGLWGGDATSPCGKATSSRITWLRKQRQWQRQQRCQQQPWQRQQQERRRQKQQEQLRKQLQAAGAASAAGAEQLREQVLLSGFFFYRKRPEQQQRSERPERRSSSFQIS